MKKVIITGVAGFIGSHLAEKLARQGYHVIIFDDPFTGKVENIEGVGCVVLTVAHAVFDKIGLDDFKKIMSSNPILIDVRGIFSKDEAERKGLYYKGL